MSSQRELDASWGIGYGCCLAMIVSYVENESILWAMIHGFFSWFYVIYFATTRAAA